jgi:hypothetical protein
VNSAVINIEVKMFLQHTDFIFLGYVSSSEFVRSYAHSIFNFLRNHNDYANLNSYKKYIKLSFLHIFCSVCYFFPFDNSHLN